MPYQNLDLRTDSQYNLIINKDRTLNAVITAQILSGNTLVDFDFSSFSGASMEVRVKPDAPYIVLDFDTSDGSIVLSTGSTFQLIKTATQLASVRSGDYFFDLYLKSALYPKYAFLSGGFKITSNITV